jgi:hypothetical protein
MPGPLRARFQPTLSLDVGRVARGLPLNFCAVFQGKVAEGIDLAD